MPKLNNQSWNYQAILAFSVSKNNVNKIVIATFSTNSASAMTQAVLDTDNVVAIGLFDF